MRKAQVLSEEEALHQALLLLAAQKTALAADIEKVCEPVACAL